MKSTIQYGGGLDIELPPEVWSNWHLCNSDISLWYRVQIQNVHRVCLLIEINHPKTETQFTCYVQGDKLYNDLTPEQSDYQEWVLQALNRVLPGVKEVSRA